LKERLNKAVCFKVHQTCNGLAARKLIKIFQKSCFSSDKSSLGEDYGGSRKKACPQWLRYCWGIQ